MNNFTEEQRAAIDARGKTIVSASAGSGKTTVMIEKIVRLIISGTDVKEILAVTFTKKAAAQMKEKLRKELIKAINSPETSPAVRAALKNSSRRSRRRIFPPFIPFVPSSFVPTFLPRAWTATFP